MKKSAPNAISTYKISLCLVRIAIGFLIIFLGFNINNVAIFLFQSDHGIRETLFSYFSERITDNTKTLTGVLAFSLILLSVVEIVFAIAMTKKKKWGLWGLFWTTLAWIPLEILFISRFLVVSKTLEIIINLILIWLLVDIIRKHEDYFETK